LITFSLLAAALALPPLPSPADAVDLGRVFTKGEKLTYQVRSLLNAESRAGELRTWIPEDLNMDYDFTMEVQDVKTEGISSVHYQRPKMTITEGETFDQTPKAKVEKVNFDLMMTISPINEILDFKDIAKKPPEGSKKKGVFGPNPKQASQDAFIGQFITEIYRLALFTGSFDSSLDISPRLQGTSVKPGDTWQKTVGYSPQKTKSTKKNIVQRLDYQYKYVGPITQNGKTFQRVEADLNLNTDLSEFINDTFDVQSDETGLKKLPLHIKAHIIWSLDPVTHHPVYAEATSEGGYEVYPAQGPEDVPYFETRMKGRTTLQLASRTLPKK
jgi:hypothetical protein